MRCSIVVDNRKVTLETGSPLLAALRTAGVVVPALCAVERPGYPPLSSCRLCLVEMEDTGKLVAACRTPVCEGMRVRAGSGRSADVRRLVAELTLSEQSVSAGPTNAASRLSEQLSRLGIQETRFARRQKGAASLLPHPVIDFDPGACIRCGLCRSACQDVQVNGVIATAGRGADTRVTFDLDAPLQGSTCTSCGECIDACPTGAFSSSGHSAHVSAGLPSGPAREADTVCPYCSVGCTLTLHVASNAIQKVTGGKGPANRGRLCVKGRFGLDMLSHKDRLTVPLVRIGPDRRVSHGVPASEAIATFFRPASWSEALDLAAEGLSRIRAEHGGTALAVLGSAKASNEDAYILQKLGRAVLGTPHIDHCTRLCASVPPLAEAIGFSAVTVPVEQIRHTDVVLMVGSNPEVNHPVAASFIKNAIADGVELILVDPYRQPFARHATHHLALRPGSDVALLSAMLNVVIAERLFDARFVEQRIDGFREVAEAVAPITPEVAGLITGVDAASIRSAARLFATAPRAMTLWGMGASQHVHGADNIRCLISLALICGHVGKPGSGLHPLRGQNNVQGSCDAGLIPTALPGYRSPSDAAARAELGEIWGTMPPAVPGLTVCEILESAHARRIRGLCVAGGNPAMANPDLGRTRESLEALEFLVVQDIFPSETAAYADVILPAAAIAEKDGTYTSTDRWVQLSSAALHPPGEAMSDWWITSEIARRMGADWRYESVGQVFDEMVAAVPLLSGLDWAAMQRSVAARMPVSSGRGRADDSLFAERFPTSSGKARLTPVWQRPPGELPDNDFPVVLVTGRLREHWHTGTMTRRSRHLDALAPRARLHVSCVDFDRMMLREGMWIAIETRRGRIRAACTRDERLQAGVVFLPFAFYEAAANELTAAHLDPTTRVPEYKLSAARIVPLNEDCTIT